MPFSFHPRGFFTCKQTCRYPVEVVLHVPCIDISHMAQTTIPSKSLQAVNFSTSNCDITSINIRRMIRANEICIPYSWSYQFLNEYLHNIGASLDPWPVCLSINNSLILWSPIGWLLDRAKLGQSQSTCTQLDQYLGIKMTNKSPKSFVAFTRRSHISASFDLLHQYYNLL